MLTIYNIYHIRSDCNKECCNGETPPDGHLLGNVLASSSSSARTIGSEKFNIPKGELIRTQTDNELTNKIANRGRTTRLKEYMATHQLIV